MKYPRLSNFLAALIIIVCAIVAGVRAQEIAPSLPAGLVVLFVVLAMATRNGNLRHARAYDNTVDTELNIARRLDIVLEAFVSMILPVNAFSMGVTDGKTLNELGTDTVLVPYIPINTAAAKDFDAKNGDCYELDGSEIEKRKVTIDKRKYKGLTRTSQQAATMPVLLQMNDRQLAMLGHSLALTVLADVLSVIDDSNFPNESAVGAANAFDTDVMFDVREDANGFKMPKLGRSAILKDPYETALLKDNKDANTYGNSQPRWDAQLPRIAGMDIYGTTSGLDGADDVDAGIVVFPSGILFAQAPVEPLPSIRRKLDDFRILTHKESGLSLVYKRMADEWCDNEGELFECTYGKEVGEEDAILRLVTA